MARIGFAGAEIDAGAGTVTQNNNADGVLIGTGTLTRDTTVFRSGGGGVASYKLQSGASNLSAAISSASINTLGANRTAYLRGYCRVTAAPGTAFRIQAINAANTTTPAIRLRTDGTLELLVNNVAQGSTSASITDSAFHRIELSATLDATNNNWVSAEARLDGYSFATWSGTQAKAGVDFRMGIIEAPGANYTMNLDDMAWNDSTGSVNNSWCADGYCALLVPTADSSVGTGWTRDNAGTTGLFNAVSVRPPAGIADTTSGNGLHQIRNATANANVNYDATMTTYAAAGMTTNSIINAILPVIATGAPVSTQAKAGTFGVASNPTIANISLDAAGTSGAFWSGAAAGTYGAGWKWSFGTMTETPSVTLGTAPVMRVTQVTSSTRIAMVCFMGIYVDYRDGFTVPLLKPFSPVPRQTMIYLLT